MASMKNRKVMLASGVVAALLVGSAAASGIPQMKSMSPGWDMLDGKVLSDNLLGGMVHKVQQQSQQQRVQLRIINTLPVPVDYYVVNPDTGQTQRINTLQPGAAADLGSQPGLGWIFVQNQQQIQSYQTRGEAFQELRIAAPGQQPPPRLANQYQPPINSQNTQQQQGLQQQGLQQQGQQQLGQSGGQPQPLGQPQRLGQAQSGGQLQNQQIEQPQRLQQYGQPGQPQPLGQQQGFGQPQPLNPQQQSGQQQFGQQQPQYGQSQGQQQQQQFGQPQGQPSGQQQRLPVPPGLYQSSLTLGDCSVSYFTPGAPEIAICQYLGRLANSDPGAYQNYLAGIQVRNNQSGGIQGQQQQQGFGTQNQGFGNSGGRFPAASSWGGIVRSGPSMQSDRLDSLSEGEVITLLADTGVQMNGYNWFQIQYRNGQSGYQWGGIICGQTQPIPGTFEICN